jgi:hypothetical protein
MPYMYRSARLTPIMAQIYRLFTAITPPPVSLVSPDEAKPLCGPLYFIMHLNLCCTQNIAAGIPS